MAHSRIFDAVARVMRIGSFCDRHGLSTSNGMEEVAALEHKRHMSRRAFLGGMGAAAVTAAGAAVLPRRVWSAGGGPRVAVVGAGMAGLACADRLGRAGVDVVVYEAHPGRVGGRVYSDRTTFPGQVAENGGELIDNLHKTMLGYANEFGLAREDLNKSPGAATYHFFGQHHTEDEVVAEYRELVARMRPDFRRLSNGPTFYNHTADDVALDNVDLRTFLATRGQGLPLIQAVLDEAYVAEYGLETTQQSTLNFLFYIHLDRRRHFAEFGVFSDERWHLIGGNDALASALASRLPTPVQHGARLTKLAKNGFGEYELYFNNGLTPEIADAVVLAIPFSTLRRVTLDPSLGLSADKMRAITQLGYGANAKTMVGFDRRFWTEQGRNGLMYSDLPNVQNVWETNWTGSNGMAILTDDASGDRGRAIQLNPSGTTSCGGCHSGSPTNSVLHDQGLAWVESQVDDFVQDLDRILPGAADAASRTPEGGYVYQRAHWSPQSYSAGSYTCYLPGQFTSIAGLESEPAGALRFAGEHTDSFYEWQGFMEGACNSGIAAADGLIADIKHGRI